MKPDPRFSPERVEVLRRRMPHGKTQVVSLEPIKGRTLAPVSWEDLGLSRPGGEKRAA